MKGKASILERFPILVDPANLFRTSGRGVLLIYNIMDEVEYNAQGNRVKMIKRPDTTVETQLIDPNTPEDKQIC
jgi:serine/threonine-protein kinase RsbW